MGKRVLIGFIALMSAVVLYGGTADAQSCLSWARVGGSSICCAWAPKGVEAIVKFNQDCSIASKGGSSFGLCNVVNTEAVGTDNVAFCETLNNGIVKVACHQQVRYEERFRDPTCDPKHNKDINPGPGVGKGHEHHGSCTQEVVLLPVVCPQDCCNAAQDTIGPSVCRDATPIEMETRVVVEAFSSDLLLQGASAQSTSDCDPESSVCAFTQHCTINPNKLKFIPPPTGENPDLTPSNQRYQCDVTCATSDLFGCCSGETSFNTCSD